MSIPGSPSRSAAPSRHPSRPASPTRIGANRRPAPGPLHIAKPKGSNKDPLRMLPTEVSQRIFGRLGIRDLGRCSRVCRKWEKSSTLNYGMVFLLFSLSMLIVIGSLVPVIEKGPVPGRDIIAWEVDAPGVKAELGMLRHSIILLNRYLLTAFSAPTISANYFATRK